MVRPIMKDIFFLSQKSEPATAADHGIRTIAFPSIATGVYHFPVQMAAQIAVRTVNGFIAAHPDIFDVVMWVLFDEGTEAVYQAEVERYGRE